MKIKNREIKPITPREASRGKLTSIPSEVYESFNELIQKNLQGNQAVVTQNEVVALICNKMKIKSRQQIFDNNWLDVEPRYEEAGWEVVFDKPGYNETYDASFTFTCKN